VRSSLRGSGQIESGPVVFLPDPETFELLAMNDLGEPSTATPAISDGEIFLRTDKHLDCIAKR